MNHKMQWRKLGVVYQPDGSLWWAKSHAAIPTPEVLTENIIRIYIYCRDENNVGRTGYVDVSTNDPREILSIANEPILDVGQPGTFDENGAIVNCIVNIDNQIKYLYYTGFELGHQIRYRLLSGLAASKDSGRTFQRIQKTPVLERSGKELYFRCASFVRYEDGVFKQWYVAGSDWTQVGEKPLPVYEIRYIESKNGIHWPDEGVTCIKIENEDEHGFGRPYVTKVNDLYKMHYSIRRRSVGYRLGYAESQDGIRWTRKDDLLGLDVSEQGWDSEAIMYSAVIEVKGNTYMFYNGNDFGGSGFGLAILDK
jgi:predicted GH43/DUF377 family glycosyl hydrolase